MVEIGLIICSFVIASKFKKAGEKGASKYILGIWGAVIAGALVSLGRGMDVLFMFMGIAYVAAIVIAVMGIKKGNFYLRNMEDMEAARADKTAREFEDLKREMEELKKASASRTADS